MACTFAGTGIITSLIPLLSPYVLRKEIAYPIGYNGIEFLDDWWEGEQYIKLFGIKTVRELDISGGLYE